MAKGNSNNTPYRFHALSNGSLQILNRSGSIYFTSTPSNVLGNYGWHHVAAVISPVDNGTHKFYVDGDSVYGRANIGFTSLTKFTDSLFIGGRR